MSFKERAGVTIFAGTLFLAAAASETFAQPAKSPACLTRFGQKEWHLLIKDVPPDKKQELLADKERRQAQAENMRQLLALSCEAVKRGIADEATNKVELGNIRSEVIAVSYDTKIRKTKTDPPFAWVTDAQVTKFYSIPAREAEFEKFLDAKVDLLRRSDPSSANKSVTDEERKSAREFYASVRIAETAAATLPEPFRSEVALRVRMQQAQFLARQVAESLFLDIRVTDKDVADYIAANPIYSDSAKKAAAAKILARAIAGEDFAALANEYTEDPGNTAADGKKNGGLYADVPVGMMVPTFEKASLALEPGQIASDLVRSDYGFHIIKLEKKSADGKKYDVRHILISTGFKDPNDPNAKELPAALFVREKLETEREVAVMKQIIARNAVVVEEYNPTATVPAKRPVGRRRRAG